MRVPLAVAVAVLLTVNPVLAQQHQVAAKPDTMMSKAELASFFRTLAADLPRWRAAVTSADPVDLNMSYATGKLMEEVRSEFLDDSDYLQRALARFMFDTPIASQIATPIKFQVVTLDIVEGLKGDLQSMIILVALNGRASDSLGKTAKELAVADARLRNHVVALSEKLDSTIEMDKLLP